MGFIRSIDMPIIMSCIKQPVTAKVLPQKKTSNASSSAFAKLAAFFSLIWRIVTYIPLKISSNLPDRQTLTKIKLATSSLFPSKLHNQAQDARQQLSAMIHEIITSDQKPTQPVILPDEMTALLLPHFTNINGSDFLVKQIKMGRCASSMSTLSSLNINSQTIKDFSRIPIELIDSQGQSSKWGCGAGNLVDFMTKLTNQLGSRHDMLSSIEVLINTIRQDILIEAMSPLGLVIPHEQIGSMNRPIDNQLTKCLIKLNEDQSISVSWTKRQAFINLSNCEFLAGQIDINRSYTVALSGLIKEARISFSKVFS